MRMGISHGASDCPQATAHMAQTEIGRPIQKDGTLQRLLVGGLGPAPWVTPAWVGPPGASTCNEHAAFSSGCGPYLVRMIHGKKARPIQKDGTLQRFLLSGLGPAPTVGQPWGDTPGASTRSSGWVPGTGPFCAGLPDHSHGGLGTVARARCSHGTLDV